MKGKMIRPAGIDSGPMSELSPRASPGDVFRTGGRGQRIGRDPEVRRHLAELLLDQPHVLRSHAQELALNGRQVLEPWIRVSE